ncbi:MAG: hypothetical protein CMI86_00970 [Candidatus Pelagibacter sp.]|nr:hypothetical protein [Candidatus Pelagibacter sp.]|tara:strand:+ start:3354 stop:3803 length:450 start_codon:yes stop_codon:yes gene_type:complete
MIKFFKLIIIFIFLNSCGFKPIFSEKKIDFNYQKINLQGNKKISEQISKNLKSLEDINSKNNLKIFSIIDQKVASKDKKGNPDIFDLKINVSLKIFKENLTIEKNFTEQISYNNKTSKFELQEFEREQIFNLTKKISQDILLYLQTINK